MALTTFAEAINQSLLHCMKTDPKTIFYALGADDPKRLFGTSKGLVEEFSNDRVFDMPTAENGMTGVAVGAALAGYKPVMTHQRLDFFLLAMDQLVNSAAKWHFMFGGQDSVPITIRLILGRGWGQGPTHSQNLQAWFAHVPGLKVVVPTTPKDARDLLAASINDPNPVVFLEHRWLHNQVADLDGPPQPVELGKAEILQEGTDVTIVSNSYMTIEALHAVKELKAKGISCELVDLKTIQPLDWNTVLSSVKKTGRLLVLDTAMKSFGVSSEIVSRASEELFDSLKVAPQRLASPDCPVPTSFGLSKEFYPRSADIAKSVSQLMQTEIDLGDFVPKADIPHDVPGDWFKGPF